MSLTPPSPAEKDVWIDFKQMQDKAQLVGTLNPPKSALLISYRRARPYTTKVIYPITKPSTKNLSRTLISCLRMRV